MQIKIKIKASIVKLKEAQAKLGIRKIIKAIRNPIIALIKAEIIVLIKVEIRALIRVRIKV